MEVVLQRKENKLRTMTHMHVEVEVDDDTGVGQIKQRVGDHPEEVVTIEITKDQAVQIAEFLLKAFRVRKSEQTSGDPAGFDEFWSNYPRKEGKATALAKWKANRCSALAEQIIAHVNSLKETKQWRDGFIPHATTYLGQKRYQDDMVEVQANPWDGAL